MSDESHLPLADRLKRASHRICALILNSDMEWIDISFEIDRMREMCLSEAPEKAELFDALYAARFERLWDQWRGRAASGAPPPRGPGK
ncbi:MAG: hypothetical protein M1457_03155 [bacterium]|nr:hypothetical protein [bacterium]